MAFAQWFLLSDRPHFERLTSDWSLAVDLVIGFGFYHNMCDRDLNRAFLFLRRKREKYHKNS